MHTTLSTSTKNKLTRIQQNIFQLYPEISELGIQMNKHRGFRNNESEFELCFQLKSDNMNLSRIDISCIFTQDVSQIESSIIMRQFRHIYNQVVRNYSS